VTDSLGAFVRDKWSSLFLHGFRITEEDPHRVVLESAAVQVVVVHDPRGEVDASVMPAGGDWPKRWSYSGMVGTASVGRLLEIALDKMRAEAAVLEGDPEFYERLGHRNETESQAWTEYYAGRGPRPGVTHLP
jgi:hypothetical protein